MTILSIALGGAIGSVLRHLAVAAVGAPWGTALVNVAGSFAIGVLYVLLSSRTALSPLLITGVLGGFTTFSAFSLDTLKLWEAGQMTPSRGLCRRFRPSLAGRCRGRRLTYKDPRMSGVQTLAVTEDEGEQRLDRWIAPAFRM